MTKVLVIFRSICRFDPQTQTRAINIRTGTKYAESIGVKREWVHPWRQPLLEKELSSMYFDIAVMELGKLLEQRIYLQFAIPSYMLMISRIISVRDNLAAG